ncbi:hypothetical protein J0H58_23685 [bacterium]|nr:hypothetical protein [bacterium]
MVGDVVAQPERGPQVVPVLEVLLDPPVVGPEELADGQGGEELVLGVRLLGGLGRVRQ